jgi:hypothetical protein
VLRQFFSIRSLRLVTIEKVEPDTGSLDAKTEIEMQPSSQPASVLACLKSARQGVRPCLSCVEAAVPISMTHYACVAGDRVDFDGF